MYSPFGASNSSSSGGRGRKTVSALEKWSRRVIPAWIREPFGHVHNHVNAVNQSKVFAVAVMITMNISNRFVNLKLSKGFENYLKITFSRNILIFCVAWMASRDVYLAILGMCLFSLFADFLLNEDSKWCLLRETFENYKQTTPPTPSPPPNPTAQSPNPQEKTQSDKTPNPNPKSQEKTPETAVPPKS